MKLKDKIKDSKKIQKLKEYKESFDILWSDPKSHAVIMLSVWFVLILLLALAVRLNGEEPVSSVQSVFVQSSDEVKDYLKKINSYKADVYIDDLFASVTDVNGEELIVYDNSTFYYKDSLYLKNNDEFVVSDDKFVSDVRFFNIYNIYSLISDKSEDYITKFSDGSYLISYSVSIRDFMLLYDNSFVDIDTNISIKFSGVDGVDKVEIDLSDFYDKIVIEIDDINSIGGVL